MLSVSGWNTACFWFINMLFIGIPIYFICKTPSARRDPVPEPNVDYTRVLIIPVVEH